MRKHFACDLCGADDYEEVPFSREYTGNQFFAICKKCGLVYVPDRRSLGELERVWSEEMFNPARYNPRSPLMKSRHAYVAEFLDIYVGLNGKVLCDVGAGEGQFLELINSPVYRAKGWGLEPSNDNCTRIAKKGIFCINNTIEGYAEEMSMGAGKTRGDIVTMMWTLENCREPRRALEIARDAIVTGGHILVATGSRILVPFKKPIGCFFSKNPTDTHPVYFSSGTLKALLAVCGFETICVNDYLNEDILCVLAKKTNRADIPWEKDNPVNVRDFFTRWREESLKTGDKRWD